MRRRFAVLVTTFATLAPVSAAQAAFFGAESIDGPNPGIQAVGDVDVSRDGTGALTYVRRDGDVGHAFVSRLVDGAFTAPEQVDAGTPGSAGQPVVAAGEGGRVVAVWVSDGQAFASVRPAPATPWTAPQPLGTAAGNPSVDMSVNGVAYATFTAGGDVRAARLERTGTSFTVLAQPVDVEPGRVAGEGAGRSRVAVSADGTAVVVWGEADHVFARRLFETRVAATYLDLTMPSLDGRAGGVADLPDIDIEDDSSFAWIVFRQAFDDGGTQRTRAIATRLRGSRLDGEAAYDGLPWGGPGVESPGVDLNGKGLGILTAGSAQGFALAGIIKDDLLNPAIGIGGNGSPAQPRGAVAEGTARVAGWVNAGDGTASGVFYDDKLESRRVPTPGPVAPLSNPAFGPVDTAGGFDVSGDRTGDFAFAFVQGAGADRRVVVAYYDRAPVSFFLQSSNGSWRNPERVPLSWSAPVDQWGTMTYTVIVDDQPVAQTQLTRFALPAGSLPQGSHAFKIQGTDRRGQFTFTKSVRYKIDTVAPKVSFKAMRSGRIVTVKAKAKDVRRSSAPSGIAKVRVNFGDGAVAEGTTVSHGYRRGGKHTIKVTATDRAGNPTVVTKTVRVR